VQFVDLGGEIYDGQKSHFRVTVNDFASYADTSIFLRPPAIGFATKLIQMCDHTSTHVDAPVHFFPGASSIDSLPVSAFCGPAICLDLSTTPGASPVVGLSQFAKALASSGLEVTEGDIVLLRLGESGSNTGLSAELADHFVQKRVKSLGVDLPTPDCPDDRTMPVHLRLLAAGITIVEGLKNLDLIAGRRFLYVGPPLKIIGATGSPIRPVAIIE
jgi:kynurenine formamidase